MTHEAKYKRWVLEYVAWRDRAAANCENVPSSIGLDGTIGGEWERKWYRGIFRWNTPKRILTNPPDRCSVDGCIQFLPVRLGNRTIQVNAPFFQVQRSAGAGEKLVIGIKRLVKDPTLRFPWDRSQ